MNQEQGPLKQQPDSDAENDEQVEVIPDTSKDSKNKNKNKLTMILIALLVVACAVIGFLVFSSDDDSAANTETNTQQAESPSNQTSQVVEIGNELDTLFYFHADDSDQPKQAFSRPASGGDRNDLGFNLASDIFLVKADENRYITRNSKSIYYGQEGQAPTEVYTAPKDYDINSAYLDQGSNTIALGIANTTFDPSQPGAQILTMNTDGSNQEVFYELGENEDFGAFYITSWNGDANQMLGAKSCYQCGGFNNNIHVIDENGIGELLIGTENSAQTVFTAELNQEKTKILYLSGTPIQEAEYAELSIQQGIGVNVRPPFELREYDITSGNDTLLTTFGEREDIRNKFSVEANVGWSNLEDGSERPVYTYQNQLYAQNAQGNFDLFFETGQGDINQIIAVTEDEVLVSSRTDQQDGSTISYFNLETTEATTVMETSFYTQITNLSFR